MRLSNLSMLFMFLSFIPQAALAGAWTLDRGQWQMISGTTISQATRGFDGVGRTSDKVVFNKVFVQSTLEYGLTNAVTLFAAPEYVTVLSATKGQRPTRARDAAVEGGARILLLTRIGMLSIQGSAKTAGAFDMSVSVDEASGRQAELRLLYGRNFKLLRHDSFADVQVSERWISRPRPNEMTVDATMGVWLTPKTLAMLQSFNTVSSGHGKAPYTFYRAHKLEFSVVRRITEKWSLQLGIFASPTGRNVVAERGFVTAVWYQG
ncbi:MAG: hypothetical protein KGJ79_05655 [Alphaproteobacteria bacterium]|nr:hypothetical protein [Alphaproteobacteria bacterium]MDE2495035.1 hypothetical protein [Alphaproteobacteria bacterium]